MLQSKFNWQKIKNTATQEDYANRDQVKSQQDRSKVTAIQGEIMLQSSQTGHTISSTQSTVAMNITEEEGKIYLYIIIQNTVSYSVVADHHFGQHPKIIQFFKYSQFVKNYTLLLNFGVHIKSGSNIIMRCIIVSVVHYSSAQSRSPSLNPKTKAKQKKQKTAQVGLQKEKYSSVQVGAGLIISVGFHLFHFCNSLFFRCLL